MSKLITFTAVTIAIAALFAPTGPAGAAGAAAELKPIKVDRSEESLRRGAQIVFDNCMRCHSLRYITYRDLMDMGFSKEEVDVLRQGKRMGEYLQTTMPPAAAKFHFGMLPPDLSLMAKARKNGPSYIYTLLTSYEEMSNGKIDNPVFPGIRMPDVLNVTVDTAPEERKIVDQKARDVVAFLEWAADPRAQERRELGVYVIAYLIILTGLLYWRKRRIWSRLKD